MPCRSVPIRDRVCPAPEQNAPPAGGFASDPCPFFRYAIPGFRHFRPLPRELAYFLLSFCRELRKRSRPMFRANETNALAKLMFGVWSLGYALMLGATFWVFLTRL